MSTWETRVENKLEKILVIQGKHQVTLDAQHRSLEEHMRRSDALEAQLRPIQRHVAMVEGILKLFGLLGVLASIVTAISRIL